MNILILTAKYGMGHYTASMSLKQELENKNTHVEVIDFFDIIFPKMKTIIYGTFNFLVSKCSRVYNFFYKFTANTDSAPFKSIMEKRIEKLLQEKNVDIIISTFPICSKYISAYKKSNNPNLKLYTYITDIEVNKEWITNQTDSYFVASNETKIQMMKNGISEENIKVVGIPVRKEFKENINSKNKKEIVIMGGGLGLIPDIDKSIEELAQNEDIHITLLAGKNQRIFNKYYGKYTNITVIGYTNEVYKYMKKAELIITKAGGITLFEAIHSNTPIYIVYPFLSQEIGNAKFVENKGLGKVIWKKTENAIKPIIKLLNTPVELEIMRENMDKIKNELEPISVIDAYKESVAK